MEEKGEKKEGNKLADSLHRYAPYLFIIFIIPLALIDHVSMSLVFDFVSFSSFAAADRAARTLVDYFHEHEELTEHNSM